MERRLTSWGQRISNDKDKVAVFIIRSPGRRALTRKAIIKHVRVHKTGSYSTRKLLTIVVQRRMKHLKIKQTQFEVWSTRTDKRFQLQKKDQGIAFLGTIRYRWWRRRRRSIPSQSGPFPRTLIDDPMREFNVPVSFQDHRDRARFLAMHTALH